MAKMAVVSLGCSKNLVDTEIMLGQLYNDGWELTDDFATAELLLVNTCGFIETAKQESIDQILELAKYKEAGIGVCRCLVAAGCLVKRYRTELADGIPEVDYWIGLNELAEIAELIKGKAGKASSQLPYLNDDNVARYRVTLPHTTFLKIAEGCSHGCAYCAIPIIKGPFHSRTSQSILTEAKALVDNGVKELNLIAQDITMYGSDLEPHLDLHHLLEKLVDSAKPEWIRLLYAYPGGLTAELLQFMRDCPNVCKYLDLPIQHISGRILKAMNRHESPEFVKERLAMIRELIPDIVLRTTFIVGFPGETDADFDELADFVREGYFEHVGVFAYSREEQTRAYNMKPQISEEVKTARRGELMQIQQGVTARLLHRFVERRQRILVDKVFGDGRAIGRTEALAPEVDGVVQLSGYSGEAGRFVTGKISGNSLYNLMATEISDDE